MKKTGQIVIAVILAGLNICGNVLAQPDQLESFFDSAHNFHFNFPDHFFNEEQLGDLEERFNDIFENQSFPEFNEFFEGHAFQDLNEFFEHHGFSEPDEFFRGHSFPDMEEFLERHPFPDFDEFLEHHPFPDLDELFGGNPFPDLKNFFPGDSIRLYERDWQPPPGNQENSSPGIEI
jgi:hypothetical protein